MPLPKWVQLCEWCHTCPILAGLCPGCVTAQILSTVGGVAHLTRNGWKHYLQRCPAGVTMCALIKGHLCLDTPVLLNPLCLAAWLLHSWALTLAPFSEPHMNPSMCTYLWVSKCNVWGFSALLLGIAGGWFFPQRGDALSLYSCRWGLAFRYSRHFPAKLGTGTKLYVQRLYHRDHVGNNPHLPCGKS